MDLPDGLDELLGRVILREIARRAHAQRPHGVLVLGMNAQHEDRDARVLGAQALEHLEEPRSGHGHVEEHHVGREPRERGQQLVAVHRLANHHQAGVVGDDPAQPLANDRVVVGDEQADHGTHPGSE